MLLAWMPPDQARTVLESGERVRLSERTLVDVDEVMKRLLQVRARGHAIAESGNAYGLRTLAAPVLDVNGRPRAGISVTVRSERTGLDKFIQHSPPPLLEVSGALTEALRQAAPPELVRQSA